MLPYPFILYRATLIGNEDIVFVVHIHQGKKTVSENLNAVGVSSGAAVS
jgi:hypothetical protein